MNNYAESKKKIDAIRNQVNEIVFRGAISHLMDVGIRHLTKDLVEDTCNKIMMEDDSRSLITNEFKCALVRTAYELAQVDHIDLLVYIQREVVYDVFDGAPSYERMTLLLDRCISWIDDEHADRFATIETLEYLDFDDEELEALGFGYVLDARGEDE